MIKKKPLFVKYMTDLGGTSLGNTYENVLHADCDFFDFDVLSFQNKKKIAYVISYIRLILRLRKTVKKTLQNGGKVIFQNLKPALFTFGIWDGSNSVIISDFSHTLYQWYRKKGIYTKNIKYYAQKVLYKKLYRLIALTDNLAENLNKAYKIPQDKIKYIPLPLDFDYYYKVPKETSEIPKILFVGGEFYRKGGNYLLDVWEDQLKGKCELIILTKDTIEVKEGITVYNHLSKGDLLHQEVFKQADLFILPTKRDAYPVVLGEAAAASMAIITTQYALGAKNIIKHKETGYIMDNPKDCVKVLASLIKDKNLINQFKQKTNQWVLEKFNTETFKKDFLEAIK